MLSRYGGTHLFQYKVDDSYTKALIHMDTYHYGELIENAGDGSDEYEIKLDGEASGESIIGINPDFDAALRHGMISRTSRLEIRYLLQR